MELPAIILISYVLAAFVVSLWTCFRGTGHLFWAGVVVWCFWCLGMLVQFSNGLEPPLWAYLAMDAAACGWFATRRDWWAQLFALTFAVQIGVELWGVVTVPDRAWWYVHCSSAFAQLAVLAGWLALTRPPVKAAAAEPVERRAVTWRDLG